MPKGKPLSEETKKKISEALKKNGNRQETGRSAAAQAYLREFVTKRVEYDELKAKRQALRDKKKALGKKKATKKERDELRKEIKELTGKMKEKRQIMKTIKANARAEKRMRTASANAKKAAIRAKRYEGLLSKLQSSLGDITNPDRKKRMRDRINRAKAGLARTRAKEQEYKNAAAGKEKRRKTAFDFCDYSRPVLLADGVFRLPRPLTFQEKRINWQGLNDAYDDIQGELETALTDETSEETERAVKAIQRKLDAGDIAGIAALTIILSGRIRLIVATALRRAFGIGKDTAAREFGIGTPATSTRASQIMRADAENIANIYASSIEQSAKSSVVSGIAAGASVAGIVGAARNSIQDTASRVIMNTSGTVIGQHVNRGRASVMFDNIARIVSFQRSEVLDSKTCPMCLSLDERVVGPSDPVAHMDIVHTHCRGLWVPVFASDETKPEIKGIPKSIIGNFDSIDGRPVVNSFKQLKKPVNDVSSKAAKEIRKRLEKAKK